MLVVSETETYNYTRIYEKAAIASGKDQIEFLHDRERTHKSLYVALMSEADCDTRKKMIVYIKGLAAGSQP